MAIVPAASAAVSVPHVALSRPVHCEPLTAAPRGEYITTTLAIGRANCPQYGQCFLFVDDGSTITVCSNRIGQFSTASSSPGYPSRGRTAFDANVEESENDSGVIFKSAGIKRKLKSIGLQFCEQPYGKIVNMNTNEV